MTPCAGSGARRARRIHGAARRGLEAMSREGAQGALAADLPRAGALPPHPRSRRGAGLQGGEPLQPMPSVWRSCRVKGAARRLRRSAAPTLDPASTQKSNKIKTFVVVVRGGGACRCGGNGGRAVGEGWGGGWAGGGRARQRPSTGRPLAVHTVRRPPADRPRIGPWTRPARARFLPCRVAAEPPPTT